MPQKCSGCGAEIPDGSKLGACPKCLMAIGLEAGAQPAGGPASEVGDRIGSYKLLEKIGEGGCGVVYMAEQHEPVRRRVALKVIKVGMDTKEVIARFEAERQALAVMEHPNIAKVFDGGTTEAGRPYFVMELVRGLRITDYCDRHKLSTQQRLELFQQVCHAVQHAHQKGIIHRDLKPSNILVTVNDGVPVPKVIDFGIAKATGQQLTDKTLFTRFQQLLGTPAYMSPEQAELTSVDIDTRSDIYSLGVLLYDLLTGRLPFEGKELLAVGFDQMLRTIREKEPVRPSAKLNGLGKAEQTTVAEQRRTDLPRLINLLRGDLDWIVMKCLEKDRGRRYETAAGLAMDIRRHLNQEPVVARPPTTAYRIQKFARRNRLMFAAATLATSALVIGLGVGSWMYVREVEALQRATAAEKQNKHLAEGEKDLRLKAEEQTLIATSVRLAAQSQSLQLQAPVLSALLAIEAVDVTRSRGKPVLPIAHESLFQALATVGGEPLPGHQHPVTLVQISSDGHWLVTASGDNTARLWDLTAQEPWSSAYALEGHKAGINVAAFSPDSRLLVTGSQDGTARVWHLDRIPLTNALVLDDEQIPITQLIFSPTGGWLATDSENGDGRKRTIVWNLSADNASLGKTTLVDTPGGSYFERTAELIVTADGPWLVTPRSSPYRGGLRLWDLTTSERKPRSLTTIAVYPVAISPNRHWLAAAVQNENAADQLLLWDLRKEMPSGSAPILYLNEVSGWLTPIEFSDDDRFLAIGNGTMVHVLDLKSKERDFAVRRFRRHASTIFKITISHDGRWLAAGERNGTVRLWDLFAGGSEPMPRILTGHANAVHSMAVSPDGRWLATGSEDKTVRLWQLSSQDPEVGARVLRGHDGHLPKVAFSLNSRWLVTAGAGGAPRFWDLQAGTPGSKEVVLRTSGISQWYERKVHLSPDGHWLAARGNPGRVWNLRAEDPAKAVINLPLSLGEASVASLTEPFRTIAPRAISGRWLVTERRDESPRLWDLKAQDPVASQQPFSDSKGPICISPDDKWLAVAGSGSIRLCDLTGGAPTNCVLILAASRRTASMVISPDSRWLVVAHENGARLWDLASKDPKASTRTLTEHSEPVSQVVFSGDSRWLFTAAIDSVNVWDLHSKDISGPSRAVHLGAPKLRLPSAEWITVTVSPNGRWLTTSVFGEEVLKLWDLATPDSSDTYRAIEGRSAIAAFSPDSRWLITAANGKPALWDLGADAADPTQRPQHGQPVFDSTAFSPDSRWLATAGLDGTTRLWDLHSSTPTLNPVVLRGHSTSVRAVEFTADGRWLVTASDDTTARLWDMDLERLTRKVRGQAGRNLTPEEKGTYLLEPPRSVVPKTLARLSVAKTPARDPLAPNSLIDLSLYYNAELDHPRNWREPNDHLGEMAVGVQRLAEVDFDVRGVAQLCSSNHLVGYYPRKIDGIRISRTAKRLHFLHATMWNDPKGTQVATIVIHYVGGQQRSIPVVFGRDVSDWWTITPAPTHATVAWTGRNQSAALRGATLRLFKMTWENPEPNLEIRALDFRSEGKGSAPFLIAITAE